MEPASSTLRKLGAPVDWLGPTEPLPCDRPLCQPESCHRLWPGVCHVTRLFCPRCRNGVNIARASRHDAAASRSEGKFSIVTRRRLAAAAATAATAAAAAKVQVALLIFRPGPARPGSSAPRLGSHESPARGSYLKMPKDSASFKCLAPRPTAVPPPTDGRFVRH